MGTLFGVPSLSDLTFADLEQTLADAGVNSIHARPLWRVLYRGLATSLDTVEHADFLPPLRRWLEKGSDYTLDVPAEVDEIPSGDGLTRKFLLRLADEQTVETVLMAYPGRVTACLSTQAGCAMGCVFCATGRGDSRGTCARARSSRRCSTRNVRCGPVYRADCATSY